jgi:predicted amidohydrolase
LTGPQLSPIMTARQSCRHSNIVDRRKTSQSSLSVAKRRLRYASACFMRLRHRLPFSAAIIIILLFGSTLAAQEQGSGLAARPAREPRALRVAAVQFKIQQSDLQSFAAFRSRIETLVTNCLAFEPDLIVFPEYTSVFPALIPYYSAIRVSQSAEDGLSRISAQDPLIDGFRDLFLLNSGLVERFMEQVFAALARRYAVAIIPGTCFTWSRRGAEAALVNRLVMYDQSGEIIYTQDKVFLTPFEEQLLELSPGVLEQAEPIVLQGQRIGITICRDTFFSDWLQVLSGVDLWIDIKANGARFTQEERQRFLRAVPARIAEGDIPYGLTVCLTGSLLDMIWEGESSLVFKEPGQPVRFAEKASSASEEQILFLLIGD